MGIAVLKIDKYFSYQDYKDYVLKCAEESTTTGNDQTEERIEATKINAQRMHRIGKQVEINGKIADTLRGLGKKWQWIILTEAWCGDGAQNIPIIAKIASLSPNIELKIILRDEYPEIMDMYLTNGSRSVPKLICIDKETEDVIGTWGPRSTGIQKMVKEYKSQNPTVSHEEFVKNLHLWYARDKGEALQQEFEQLILQWSSM